MKSCLSNQYSIIQYSTVVLVINIQQLYIFIQKYISILSGPFLFYLPVTICPAVLKQYC